MPPATAPEDGGLWDSIFGPILPLLSNAWWIVIHFVLPLGLLVGALGYVAASMFGDRRMASRFRGVIFSVPIALFLVSAAVLVSNWVIGHYA